MLILIWTTLTTLPISFTFGQKQYKVQLSLGDNTGPNFRLGNLFTHIPSLSSDDQTFPSRMLKPDREFELRPNGDLFTKLPIDRDVVCAKLKCCEEAVCTLRAEAYFFTSANHPLVIEVLVTLSDENDNPPSFDLRQGEPNELPGWLPHHYQSLPYLQISVPESAKIGTQLVLPCAHDPDSREFGVSSYELQGILPPKASKSQRNDFRLVRQTSKSPNCELNLLVSQNLDREREAAYWFELRASDGGTPSLTGTLLLQVKVDDVNDHSPVFIQPRQRSELSIEVPENTEFGHAVYTFRATDADVGDNAKVTYLIDRTSSYSRSNRQLNKWALDEESGILTVSGILDYENEDDRKFVLRVVARDSGTPPLSATTSLTILLTDTNDNPPLIDVRSAGLATGNAGGKLTTSPVELRSEPELVENDAQPRLLKVISVSDADAVSAGKVTCSLGSARHQRIDFTLREYAPLMYGLFNNRAFDFEEDADKDGNINVVISCMDNASPALSSEAIVPIALQDLNDNWPVFERQSYHFAIYENLPKHSEIGRIQAFDKDRGLLGKITYWLTSDVLDNLDLIEINPQTGFILTKGELDREQSDTLTFRVTAADGGTVDDTTVSSDSVEHRGRKTNTTILTIRLLDVNDNAPVYTGPLEVHIDENTRSGAVVVPRLQFYDRDSGENGTVKVFLGGHSPYAPHNPYDSMRSSDLEDESQRTNSDGVFSLIGGHELVLTGSLDRETHSRLLVRLIAVDSGRVRQLTSTTTLTVIVDDVNDNAPQLLHPRNATLLTGVPDHTSWGQEDIGTLPVDTPADTLVTTVRARDIDDADNAYISFRLRRAEPHELWYTQGEEIINANAKGVPFLHVNPLQRRKLVLDGTDYFFIDEKLGHLRTFWQKANQASPKTTETVEVNTTSSRESRGRPFPKPPPIGLLALVVQLTDHGHPPQVTTAIFYVNISEATNRGYGFSVFGLGEASLSNSIILILIIVCSFALVISLTAAIFWVRFRVDSGQSRYHLRLAARDNGGVVNGGRKLHANFNTYFPANISAPGDNSEHGNMDGVYKPLSSMKWNRPDFLDAIQCNSNEASEMRLLDPSSLVFMKGVETSSNCVDSAIASEDMHLLPAYASYRRDVFDLTGRRLTDALPTGPFHEVTTLPFSYPIRRCMGPPELPTSSVDASKNVPSHLVAPRTLYDYAYPEAAAAAATTAAEYPVAGSITLSGGGSDSGLDSGGCAIGQTSSPSPLTLGPNGLAEFQKTHGYSANPPETEYMPSTFRPAGKTQHTSEPFINSPLSHDSHVSVAFVKGSSTDLNSNPMSAHEDFVSF
ncbi:unnamed protein product [Schistocephalus solidus]|uniref:Protocadherin-1 n=1 Tax=Schistocephalus solidus TaxID=70667 RepID=A0A183TDF1_SCHSO|nr:unnamed protein product [Schistocephalus solidus]